MPTLLLSLKKIKSKKMDDVEKEMIEKINIKMVKGLKNS